MSIVRVLVVTDDGGARGGFLQWRDQSAADATGPSSREFHLGEFLDVLTTTKWVGFTLEITKAHRATAGTGGLNEAQLKADRGADVIGFRFDAPHVINGATRTLASYDMVLFFAIDPGNPNTAFAAEAETIARYMESGGGFFATGDHANLGSKLCGLIPRVRSMRRWWYPSPGPAGEPAAPDPLSADRHDTTQAGLDGVRNFEDQSDEIAQPIDPTLYVTGIANRLVTKFLPHPLLCSPEGIVRYLPDHMHEGTCEVPDNLAARTFTLDGASVREYPDGLIGPLAPELVATGKVTAGTTSPTLDSSDHVGGTTPTHAITFGVIAAWDGHRIGKGRVVVDSTWHHFFNINLTGDRYLDDLSLAAAHDQKRHGFYVPDGIGGRKPNDQYKKIMWYFRNIIYWLIPVNRYRLILWDTVLELARRPQLSEEIVAIRDRELTLGKYLYLAQLAEAYFASARGHCAIYEFHQIIVLFQPKIPWWEWVQQHVDVWDPVARDKGRDERVAQEQYLGTIGLGPQPETAARLGLGAVVAAAGLILRDRDEDAEKLADELDKRFTEAHHHALGLYARELAAAREVHAKVEQLLDGAI